MLYFEHRFPMFIINGYDRKAKACSPWTSCFNVNKGTFYGKVLQIGVQTCLLQLEDFWLNCQQNLNSTAQKMKIFIKDFSNKCDHIRRKLRIWSNLLKKSLLENFILLCSVDFVKHLRYSEGINCWTFPLLETTVEGSCTFFGKSSCFRVSTDF